MDPLNTSPVASGSQMPPIPEPHKHGIGPIAGAIVVIFLLAAGGLYFWGAQLNKQAEPLPYIPSTDSAAEYEPTTPLSSDASAGLPAQGTSDDVSSIEADANAMDMGRLEAENAATLNNI